VHVFSVVLGKHVFYTDAQLGDSSKKGMFGEYCFPETILTIISLPNFPVNYDSMGLSVSANSNHSLAHTICA